MTSFNYDQNFSGFLPSCVDRTITWLLEGIKFICGPSSIICARGERVQMMLRETKINYMPDKSNVRQWLSLLSLQKAKSCKFI